MADKDLIERLKDQIAAVESGVTAAVANSGDGVGTRAEHAGGPARCEPRRAGGVTAGDASNAADRAFSKIVALVNVSDRSEHAIRERLERSGFAPEATEEAVERAKSCGFIDDMRFAATLIRSRLSQGRGIPGIERELRGHGIDIDAVAGWPDDFEVDDGSEVERALEVLERRPPRSKNLRDGAYRKLLGKGFSSAAASSAARIWFDSLDAAD